MTSRFLQLPRLVRIGLLVATLAWVIVGLAIVLSPREQNVSVAVNGVNRWCLPDAVTPDQQAAGLRNSVQVGMVFTFSPPQNQAFWNQGVSRQLLIVWVRGGQVLGTGDLEPYSSSPVSPPSAIDYAIELTPGMWSKGWQTVAVGPAC